MRLDHYVQDCNVEHTKERDKRTKIPKSHLKRRSPERGALWELSTHEETVGLTTEHPRRFAAGGQTLHGITVSAGWRPKERREVVLGMRKTKRPGLEQETGS